MDTVKEEIEDELKKLSTTMANSSVETLDETIIFPEIEESKEKIKNITVTQSNGVVEEEILLQSRTEIEESNDTRISVRSAMSKTRKPLRFITYMCPTISIEYFETVVEYLEDKMKMPIYLIYESRWNGPPEGRIDPFTAGIADMAFMCSTAYLRLLDDHPESLELLPVSSVHIHKRDYNVPGHFADVITLTENCERVKNFEDLRGCRWAVNEVSSLSGSIVTMHYLRLMGENTTFFAHILHSGSHLNSIQMVLQKQVDAAAVDANCLAMFLDKYPMYKKEVYCVDSWGPLPPYPIIISKRLAGSSLRTDILTLLLSMHEDPVWGPRLMRHHVRKFAPISDEMFNRERDIVKSVTGLGLKSVYY